MPQSCLIGSWGTFCYEIFIKIKFSFKKMHFKMSSGQWGHFVSASVCLKLNKRAYRPHRRGTMSKKASTFLCFTTYQSFRITMFWYTPIFTNKRGICSPLPVSITMNKLYESSIYIVFCVVYLKFILYIREMNWFLSAILKSVACKFAGTESSGFDYKDYIQLTSQLD